MIQNQELQDRISGLQNIARTKGAISNKDLQMFTDAGFGGGVVSDEESKFLQNALQGGKGALSNKEMDMLRDRLLGSGFSEPRITEPRLEDGSPIL